MVDFNYQLPSTGELIPDFWLPSTIICIHSHLEPSQEDGSFARRLFLLPGSPRKSIPFWCDDTCEEVMVYPALPEFLKSGPESFKYQGEMP